MMRSAALALLSRDARLLWRRRGDALQPALFALLVVVLFALALGGEQRALERVAAPVLWLAVGRAGPREHQTPPPRPPQTKREPQKQTKNQG